MKMNELKDRLNSPDESERIYAVQDIGETNDPEWAVSLVERLEMETSQVVKDAILFYLEKMPCHKAYAQLFQLFQSTDAFLRNAAVSIFGSDNDEAVAFLTTYLDNADREVRKLVLDALFLIRTSEAILAIRAGLHDLSVNVRITAVEYLGRLAATESVPELMEVLEKTGEPMLKSSILESLSLMEGPSDIGKILAVLGAAEDIQGIDPIYMPAIIRLIGRSGNLEFICRILDIIQDIRIYAPDIVQALEDAGRRFENIIEECRILEMVLSMIAEKNLPEKIRYRALELLLNNGLSVAVSSQLFSLGQKLIEEPNMVYAGVRILAVTRSRAAGQLIETIQNKTGDEEIRFLCEELLADFSVDSDR